MSKGQEAESASARADAGAGRAVPAGLPQMADYALRLAAVGAIYFALAKGGLALASINPSATPIWPPTGFALAALLLGGYRLWPALFVGALLANVTTAGTLTMAAAIASGNALEALIAAHLLMRYSGGRATFDTPAGVARFVLICAFSGTLVSSGVGVATLHVAGFAATADLPAIWATWWLGDVAGALVVAPAIVLWAARRPRRHELVEVGMVYGAAAAVGLVAFSPLLDPGLAHGPLAFLAILPLMWAAFRCQRDTATVALILSAFAVWGALAGAGPFAPATLNQKFLLLLSFLGSATVPSLALSSALAVRRRTEERQALLTAELDHRVRNILATIQATSRLTARSAPSKEAYARALEGRIAAMARTHGLLAREFWQGARLADILDDELRAHAGAPSCFAVRAPECMLQPRQALNLALLVHELATNAAKYGALSKRDGLVTVTATVDEDRAGIPWLRLHWRESGGPPVTPPAVKGFGSQLFERTVAQAEMHMTVAYASQGVECQIEMPLSS